MQYAYHSLNCNQYIGRFEICIISIFTGFSEGTVFYSVKVAVSWVGLRYQQTINIDKQFVILFLHNKLMFCEQVHVS